MRRLLLVVLLVVGVVAIARADSPGLPVSTSTGGGGAPPGPAGPTGTGSAGYLTLWSDSTTLTGTNNGTNEGLVYTVNSNAWNSLGARAWGYFDAGAAGNVRLQVNGSNYNPADHYTAQLVLRRQQTDHNTGVSWRIPYGYPAGERNSWFFGQLEEIASPYGRERWRNGKISLLAADQSAAMPTAALAFVSFRQHEDAFFEQPENPGLAIFNESLNNYDFQVSGDTDAHALFVDGSSDSVGIGEPAPSSKLHVDGDVRVAGGTLASPALKLADGNTGFYSTTTDETSVASDGEFVAAFGSGSKDTQMMIRGANDTAGNEAGQVRAFWLPPRSVGTTIATVPTCTAALVGAHVYVDDTDDSKPGIQCVCTLKNDNTTHEWIHLSMHPSNGSWASGCAP
jgi:hypothetical protein